MKVLWRLLLCMAVFLVGNFYWLVALSPPGASHEQKSIQKIAETTGRTAGEVRESMRTYGDWPPDFRY